MEENEKKRSGKPTDKSQPSRSQKLRSRIPTISDALASAGPTCMHACSDASASAGPTCMHACVRACSHMRACSVYVCAVGPFSNQSKTLNIKYRNEKRGLVRTVSIYRVSHTYLQYE